MNCKFSILLVLLACIVIPQSVHPQYFGLDTTKIGIEEGDEFTYSVETFEVIGEYSQENIILYNDIDYSGVSEFKMEVIEIKEPSDDPDAYCLLVFFNVTLSENNVETTFSCLDVFQHLVVLPEWDYFEERIKSDMELFADNPDFQYTLNNGEKFEFERSVNVEHGENSYFRINWGYVRSESYLKLINNKATGMATHKESMLWLYLENGSKEGYHVSIFEGKNDADQVLIIVSGFTLIGIVVIPILRVLRRKK